MRYCNPALKCDLVVDEEGIVIGCYAEREDPEPQAFCDNCPFLRGRQCSPEDLCDVGGEDIEELIRWSGYSESGG